MKRSLVRRPAPAAGLAPRAGLVGRAGLTGRIAGAILLSVVAVTSAAGCDDGPHRDIQDEINILTRRNDVLVPPATERLARYGRMAISQIETAIHTAAPMGRLHLIAALARVGDGEAVPILRHFAVYDVSPEVRGACEDLLARWAGVTDGSAADQRRAERARLAQIEIARKRAAGEAPMIFAGGTPGAPASTTVGAPEPVGIDLEKTPH